MKRARLLSLSLLCLVALAIVPGVSAQDFSGTYTLTGPGGPTITLVLRQAPTGQITGKLSGNAPFDVQAQVRDGQFAGYASSPDGRLYLEGRLEGSKLRLAIAEVGADGRPLVQTARNATFERATPSAPTAPAKPPLSRPGSVAADDPYAGTFTSPELSVVISRAGDRYTGVATYQGAQYPLDAQLAGGRLAGSYQAEGTAHPFQAVVLGEVMTLATGSQTFTLRRQSGAVAGALAGPGTGGAMGGPGAQTGGVAATPQDQQIAQLLLRSAWCSSSYRAVPGSSSSGRSSTERIVFAPDGTGFRRTGGESYSSGASGSVAGQRSGGEPFRWQLRGGALNVSSDGLAWESIPLAISQNSSGWPIVKASGKEYSMCD